MLGVSDLNGRRFLDAGCGSGIFSLAARRLGAVVHSFDYDPVSVESAQMVRGRFAIDDTSWSIERGDVLDGRYVSELGEYDVVYCWGVLHHTGAMWRGLDNLARVVSPGGLLYVALYNDQGRASRRWRSLKHLYVRSAKPAQWGLVLGALAYFELRAFAAHTIRAKNPLTFRSLLSTRTSVRTRGMSPWHDLIDWVGGYPFEVCKPDQVFDYLRVRGYSLERLVTTNGLGCNQFVFRRQGG
jgi:SAM-dependent methyltransferase